MANCEKILIAGFSGAGKSSFLAKLQSFPAAMGWDFDDLDQLILKKHGNGKETLAQVIEREGWEKFRLWERQELESWLKKEGKGVLALGGGTLSPLIYESYRSNRKIKFCYLQADFETCWERLNQESVETRPLIKKGKDELRKIFNERQMVFKQMIWKLENSKSTDLSKLAEKFWNEV